MAKTKEQRLQAIHEEAISDFDEIYSAYLEERKQCLEDRRFYSIAGAQWEGDWSDQFENKPKFEVNKVHLAVIRIINDYRNNRITVDFIADETKNENNVSDDLADTCDGLYRADEQDSSAEEAYDNAFEEAVGGGFGAWRLRAVYEDEDDDDDERQRIEIEPIYDADSSVYFDLSARKQDKSDAKRCYVLSPMTVTEYEEEYSDSPTTWPKEISDTEFDWATPEAVHIAEYYRVERRREVIITFESLDGEKERYTESELAADPDIEHTLVATGSTRVGEKRRWRRRVHKYILSGGKVLEDEGYIAGTEIPVIPVYGKRWVVDGIERCMGHVRLVKDVQRLKNMQMSKLGELSAQSPVEKPIFTPEQVAGHEIMWSEDNVKNYPYLLVNPTTDVTGAQIPSGALGYTKPPAIPPALAALLQMTEEDMREILGNQEGGEDITANISGKAVELIQSRLDMQSFIYVSNLAKAMKRSGQIWLSMAKDLLVEQNRKMKVVAKDGEVDYIELSSPVRDEDTGKTIYENEMRKAKLKVNSSVGPSSNSKRSSTVRNLMAMLQLTQEPDTRQVLSSMIMMNMEGEGMSETRDYFRSKLVKLGVVKPTKQEAEEMANAEQRPDPNAEYLQAAARAEDAKTAKVGSEIENLQAKTEKTTAETLEIMSELDRPSQETMQQ